jgi:hypothetical protein
MQAQPKYHDDLNDAVPLVLDLMHAFVSCFVDLICRDVVQLLLLFIPLQPKMHRGLYITYGIPTSKITEFRCSCAIASMCRHGTHTHTYTRKQHMHTHRTHTAHTHTYTHMRRECAELLCAS